MSYDIHAYIFEIYVDMHEYMQEGLRISICINIHADIY